MSAPIDLLSPSLMASATGSDPTRALRVGFNASLSRGPLRNLLRNVWQRASPPKLFFLEGGRTEVLLAARRGDVDIAFVPGPEDWTRLSSEELWRDRLMVALAEDHPLASDNSVRGEDLQRQAFLASGTSADRQAQFALVERAIGGEPAGFVCTQAGRDSLMNLVGLGFGVALVEGTALGTFYPGVVYRPIATPWTVLPYYAVWRPSRDNPELGPFLVAARDAAKDWARPQ
jgi:DNA-binding transcriptional LysR family regulator